jgi:phage tail-like protein
VITLPDCSQAPEPPVTDRPGTGLVVGTDPAGSTWVIFRYPEDWQPPEDPDRPGEPLTRPPTLQGVVYDPVRGVAELEVVAAPLPLDAHGQPRRTPPPLQELVAPDGTRYRSRPSLHLVERKRPPDSAFEAIPCFGGNGRATGRLRRPYGLGWDSRDYLLVSDSGNHRVQVVRPEDGSVAAVLGCADLYGRPQPGIDGGAMLEPVDVAASPSSDRIYVADRAGGRVHVFDARFQWVQSFRPDPAVPRPPGLEPRPYALSVQPDGTLLVADESWPRVLHLGPAGEALGDLPAAATGDPRFTSLGALGAYEPEGEIVIGPLDSGSYGASWHEVVLDAELPEGTAVLVQTWATEDPAAAPVPAEWAPAEPTAVPSAQEVSGRGLFRRLVLSDWSRWQAWLETDPTLPPPAPTDRGRYLWVRLRLLGAKLRPSDTVARRTPAVSGLKVTWPRPTLLRWLPGHWSRPDHERDPSGALFVERFLALCERVLTQIEVQYEDLARLLDPRTAPSGWLEWLGTWLALSFDPSWPLERRRALIREALSLYRRRGTPAGLARYVEVYVGLAPVIVERFRWRGTGRRLGMLVAAEEPSDPDEGAHIFDLYVTLGQSEARTVVEGVVRAIVEAERPAHTLYELRFVDPDARVGLQSTVGIDLVLGDAPASTARRRPASLDEDGLWLDGTETLR